MLNQKTLIKKVALSVAIALTISTATSIAPWAVQAGNDSRQVRWAPSNQTTSKPIRAIDPKNLPDFAVYEAPPYQGDNAQDGGSRIQLPAAAGDGQSGTALKADLASATLPTTTHMKLVLETIVDAKTSQPGDIFEAHVKDDLFIGTVLLLPKGSLVRGRVFEVTKPRLLSRAAKIGLKLEQIATPQGEVIPLDAALEFQKGLTNTKGQLDPGTNFGTRVESSVRSVTGMNSSGAARNALIAANVATLGAPAVATAIGSSAIAIFKAGDNVSLAPGQELEIQLTNDLGLQLN
ncbi:MAG: TrbI/VirB10 family protein [Candidatus Obscuribacter phosphatis]|uniref:TrbI/VirB10 family protein n=1 Tax=Candidatus Obscuribacter phosphatis TaxID=1906157 RepID=A0A8J7PCU0_9BACT|nr:TrbI/VirB10 family protein [Candidatus Obscuribacter phosphatis]